MISTSDFESIENILKWNKSRQNETEVVESTKGKDQNATYNIYHIMNVADEKVSTFFCNESDDILNNGTDLSDICVSFDEYDAFEATVVVVLFLLIVVTVIGNTLIISAVLTTKRLRTVTNCFVTSLAVADLLVGIFVMPPAIAVHISGKNFYVYICHQ